MWLDAVSIWGILFGSMGLVLLCLEIGIRLGRRRRQSGKGKLEISGAMVGAVMGLLSFLLAFTFNGAATRHESRKTLVVKEAMAIEQTWLRAGLLGEPGAASLRAHLREYTDVRLAAVLGTMDLKAAVRRSVELHEEMWEIVEGAGRLQPGSIGIGLLTQSVSEVIDLHVERITLALRNRIPGTIWATLYLLLAAGMTMVGNQIGQAETRHFDFELALALTFSMVLFLISDLDRPQEGLLSVSQEAMVDLQTKMHAAPSTTKHE